VVEEVSALGSSRKPRCPAARVNRVVTVLTRTVTAFQSQACLLRKRASSPRSHKETEPCLPRADMGLTGHLSNHELGHLIQSLTGLKRKQDHSYARDGPSDFGPWKGSSEEQIVPIGRKGLAGRHTSHDLLQRPPNELFEVICELPCRCGCAAERPEFGLIE
jgi:hypothetical protein